MSEKVKVDSPDTVAEWADILEIMHRQHVSIDNYGKVNSRDFMKSVLGDIRSGRFDKELSNAVKDDYAVLRQYDKEVDNSELVKAHAIYNKIHREKKGEKK